SAGAGAVARRRLAVSLGRCREQARSRGAETSQQDNPTLRLRGHTDLFAVRRLFGSRAPRETSWRSADPLWAWPASLVHPYARREVAGKGDRHVAGATAGIPRQDGNRADPAEMGFFDASP